MRQRGYRIKWGLGWVKGFFITAEGIDFCGNDTHAEEIAAYLAFYGYPFIKVRDPGETELGIAMRELLGIGRSGMAREPSALLRAYVQMAGVYEISHADGTRETYSLLEADFDKDATTESLVFLAARAKLVDEKIRPALREGKIVVCNRYRDSTFAYQGYGRGEDLAALRAGNLLATDGLEPDLMFLVDITVEEMLRRVDELLRRSDPRGIRDRIETAGPEFFERVRQGYLTIAREEPKRVVVIDGARTVEENREEILAVVERRLSEAGIEPRGETLWMYAKGRERSAG